MCKCKVWRSETWDLSDGDAICSSTATAFFSRRSIRARQSLFFDAQFVQGSYQARLNRSIQNSSPSSCTETRGTCFQSLLISIHSFLKWSMPGQVRVHRSGQTLYFCIQNSHAQRCLVLLLTHFFCLVLLLARYCKIVEINFVHIQENRLNLDFRGGFSQLVIGSILAASNYSKKLWRISLYLVWAFRVTATWVSNKHGAAFEPQTSIA